MANILVSIPPEIIRKARVFLLVIGGIETNYFAQICLILEVKFGNEPKCMIGSLALVDKLTLEHFQIYVTGFDFSILKVYMLY